MSFVDVASHEWQFSLQAAQTQQTQQHAEPHEAVQGEDEGEYEVEDEDEDEDEQVETFGFDDDGQDEQDGVEDEGEGHDEAEFGAGDDVDGRQQTGEPDLLAQGDLRELKGWQELDRLMIRDTAILYLIARAPGFIRLQQSPELCLKDNKLHLAARCLVGVFHCLTLYLHLLPHRSVCRSRLQQLASTVAVPSSAQLTAAAAAKRPASQKNALDGLRFMGGVEDDTIDSRPAKKKAGE